MSERGYAVVFVVYQLAVSAIFLVLFKYFSFWPLKALCLFGLLLNGGAAYRILASSWGEICAR